MKRETTNNDFSIKDCTLVAVATGLKARTLREVRSIADTISPSCIYYHFWGALLRSRFDDPEFPNDFASWASHSLHDKKLAERLAIINPMDFRDLEDLRKEVLEVIDERLDELDMPSWVDEDRQFYFVHSQIVVFDTKLKLTEPQDLLRNIDLMSLGSIFYHFIDARRRNPDKGNDFSRWLHSFDGQHDSLVRSINNIDPYFTTLHDIQREIKDIVQKYYRNEQ